MASQKAPSSFKPSLAGFTLVEIMVVVVIVGLLAAMSIPAFQRARHRSYATRLANDFRSFAASFEMHALEVGVWPDDGNYNDLPVSAQPYFEGTTWYLPPPNGGIWDWEVNRLGFVASVGLTEGDGHLAPEVYELIDEILDDGDLSTGFFQKSGDRYLYILEK